MRFHVVSLPHTHTTAAFPSCAFTQKVVRFCKMMTDLGHEVFLYAGEQNEAPCTDHIPCISEKRRAEMVGESHYTEADWSHPYWRGFNANVIGQMHERIEPQDFICLIGGYAHKPIADAFPSHISVEFGIGYSGTFAKYRVFESYAWMHTVYGAQVGNAGAADGHWFDAVIPNQIEDGLYPLGKGDGGYALYVGRLIDRKGYRIAQEVCQAKDVRLILAGPGQASGYGEFVGEVDAKERARLMAGAKCLFAPTQYIEPFGTVHIEAMACGTPIIATDWGVFTETIEQGVHGFRCRSFAEFCEALDEAGTLDRERIRQDAIRRFSMATVSRQYEAYFTRLSTLWDKGWYQETAS
jgi:glycosyltransferase involved in cell wall biosynthesis